MASFITTINYPISSSGVHFFQSHPSRITTPSAQRPSSSSSSSSSSSFLSPRNAKKKKRGSEVVTRAGPSSTSLIFAFVMPLTLFLVTVFTSIKIADKLDDEFLEELAINQAIMQGEENDEDSSRPAEEKPAVPTWAQEKAPVPRIRNRPKRQAEV